MMDKQAFIEAIPPAGSIGNISLRKKLGIGKKKYEELKKELLAEGKIIRGGGMGGSVSRAAQPEGMEENDVVSNFETYKKDILQHIPEDGTPIGNITLRRKAAVTEQSYWEARNKLYDDGIIGVGGGMGGSVYLLKGVKTSQGRGKGKAKAEEKYPDEKSLYKDLHATIEKSFAKDQLLLDPERFIISQTANRRRRVRGVRNYGTWTVPDFSIVAIKQYSFLPGKILEIITFEIKHYRDFDAKAVYEAAAHNNVSNRSFLGVYIPEKYDEYAEKSSEDFIRILSECSRLGVGFFHFSDPAKYETFELKIDAKRHIPDPAYQDHFICNVVPARDHDTIRMMIR